MNIAVFASGKGSNFAAINSAIKKGRIKARLVLLVCDNPSAGVIKKAENAKIKIALIKRDDFKERHEFENEIIRVLLENKIGLVVLAGFMRLLGKDFVEKLKGRIINIHPALLPAFKGSTAVKDAFDYGAKVTGVTVHFVDEKMDHGPIIMQQPLLIKENDTLRSLEKKIHAIEHKLYPQAINLFVNKKIRLSGRKVRICAR